MNLDPQTQQRLTSLNPQMQQKFMNLPVGQQIAFLTALRKIAQAETVENVKAVTEKMPPHMKEMMDEIFESKEDFPETKQEDMPSSLKEKFQEVLDSRKAVLDAIAAFKSQQHLHSTALHILLVLLEKNKPDSRFQETELVDSAIRMAQQLSKLE